MPVNTPELANALEILSRPDAMMHLSDVMRFTAALAGAQEAATVTI